jgi:hypothetical protein
MYHDINTLTDKEIRNLEARLRRILLKQGLLLKKGKDAYKSTGYMIYNGYTNSIVNGAMPNVYSLCLEDVVEYAES